MSADKKNHKTTHELEQEVKTNADLAAERLTQLTYLKADFENFQKRFAKEKIENIKCANESLIKELLVFLDDFAKAVMIEKSEGLKKLYQEFYSILEKNGLKPIDAVGKKFDPYYHEVMLKEKSDQPEDTVIEELQKGYFLNTKVIRHSKVKISGGNTNG